MVFMCKHISRIRKIALLNLEKNYFLKKKRTFSASKKSKIRFFFWKKVIGSNHIMRKRVKNNKKTV